MNKSAASAFCPYVANNFNGFVVPTTSREKYVKTEVVVPVAASSWDSRVDGKSIDSVSHIGKITYFYSR